MSEDDELLAAELALRLIEGDERQAAERRCGRDAEFAAAVARWEDHAATMLAAGAEPPPPSLWSQVAARLPANDAASAAVPAGAGSRGWKAATFAATAAAVALAIFAVAPRPVGIAPAAAPAVEAKAPLVAMLTAADSKAVVAVSYDVARRRLTLVQAALDADARSAELWVIPADKKPRSLGIIDASGNWRTAPAGAAAAIVRGATLAVTIEPAGGSPSGQPTGPVVLSGTIEEI